MAAARAAFDGRRLVAAFQPHLYSRTRDFAKEFGLTFDILYDSTGAIQKTYQTTGVPENFLLDADGVIRKKAYAQDWNSETNRALIARPCRKHTLIATEEHLCRTAAFPVHELVPREPDCAAEILCVLHTRRHAHGIAARNRLDTLPVF